MPEEKEKKDEENSNKRFFTKVYQKIQTIFQSLKIKSRKEKPEQESINYNSYAVLSLRLNNMDVMILPFTNIELNNNTLNLSIQLKKYLLVILNPKNLLNHQMKLYNAMLLKSKIAYIPTSAGMQ